MQTKRWKIKKKRHRKFCTFKKNPVPSEVQNGCFNWAQ